MEATIYEPVYSKATPSFKTALIQAEEKGTRKRWCVTMKYGVFCAYEYELAKAKDMFIVCVTV